MLVWRNIGNGEEGEVDADKLNAFVDASQGIVLSVFADPNFPELICICAGEDAKAMVEKANRGIVQSLQSADPVQFARAV